jgi:hypothetical protein
MIDLEMRLGAEIAKAVEKDNIVVFRNEKTNQPYALFKLKDEQGAVSKMAKGLYLVTAKDFKDKKAILGASKEAK